MSALLHGGWLIPHRTSSAANLRQQLRAPRQCIKARRSICIKSQAASTTQKQQPASEEAQQQPTASLDTTHVPIKTGKPTDPAHVTNGAGSKAAGMEVDSVLAQELSENGMLRRQLQLLWRSAPSRLTGCPQYLHTFATVFTLPACRVSEYKTYKDHMYNRTQV